jgi:hypothetical protein
MFIIHRRTVEAGGKRDKVDAIYWILDERIYPTPSLYDIMANRTVCPHLLLPILPFLPFFPTTRTCPFAPVRVAFCLSLYLKIP